MKLRELLEARKNPEQNPKTSINDIIARRLNKTHDMNPDNIPNLYVSFTKIEKLGINPRSEYKTPLGIYAYPASYIIDEIGSHAHMSYLPFAGDFPYANLFNARGNIIDLNRISEDEVVDYGRKIAKLWANLSQRSWKTSVDDIEEIVVLSSSRAIRAGIPGGRLWYITREAVTRYFSEHWDLSVPVAWNKLFRMIGIDGAVDLGKGIMHSNEATQAVFFSTQSISNNQRIENKYSGYTVRSSQTHGTRMKHLQQLVSAEKLNSMSPKDQIENIQNRVWGLPADIVKYVTNPEVMKALLHERPSLFRFMRNVPEELEYNIVTDAVYDGVTPSAVLDGLVPMPRERSQLFLVTKDPLVFLLFKKSTLAVMKTALKYNQFPNTKQSIIKHAADIGLQPWVISKENK